MHGKDKYTSRHGALKWKIQSLKQKTLFWKGAWTEQDQVAASFRNIPPQLRDRNHSWKGEMKKENIFVILFHARQCLFRINYSDIFGLNIQNIVCPPFWTSRLALPWYGNQPVITKVIWGELFLSPNNSNKVLFVCFAIFCFPQISAGKGSLSRKMSVGPGHYGRVIGKQMT